MSRIYQYYQEPGHLFPYDIQFDVDDIAFCEEIPRAPSAGGERRDFTCLLTAKQP